MKYIKKIIVLCMLSLMGVFSTTIYAAESSNVVVKSEQKDDKTIEYLASEDGYISRITQPNKINMTTFESKINLMGEASSQGTEITIEIYNTKTITKAGKTETIFKTEPTYAYKLGKVGATCTFNQILDLSEGENQIVVKYINVTDKVDNKMIFYITRESEENKQQIKNFVVFPSVKISQ